MIIVHGDKLDAWNYPLKDGSSLGYYRRCRYDRAGRMVIIEYGLLGIYCLRSIQLQR